MRLSPVVLALLPGLAASSAYAAVYQVQELPEVSTTRSQYGAAINDNGEIMATALVRRPLLDATGQQQTAEDGSVVLQEQATAVKLRPIANGQPANCDGEDTRYERKSGSFQPVWLLLLAMFPLFRRRFAKG